MNYLSTGRASKLLSVTPDTILKWVKQGKLPALRTAGGHYRISRDHISALMGQIEQPIHSNDISEAPAKSFLYCWEFFAQNGGMREGCLDCLAYRAKALKCYEMNHLSNDTGYNGNYCSISCENCSYFRYQQEKPFNVLVITDSDACRESLASESSGDGIRLQFANCEYESSLVIGRFRPDFVVVDCGMQEDKCRELCHHLANDPRIKGNTVILATPARRLSLSFPGTIRIRHPFSLKDLEEFLRDTQTCHSIQAEQCHVTRGGTQ